MGSGGPGDWLRAGRVGRPHGLGGGVHVIGANPLLLVAGREVMLGPAGARRRIERRAGHDGRVILHLEGCASRDAADELRGTELFVPRSLAPPLGEDEWWAEELEGCTVYDGDTLVGVVARLIGLPSWEVLEVARATASDDEEPLLVPLVSDAVRSVDVARRRVDVDLGFLGEA